MKKFLTCSTPVRRGAVKREIIDGVEHIRISSYTLPDDIVMNGGLYPTKEIEACYETLDRSLAPVEHPEKDGMFISARDPYAINNFYAGAHNENVRRENGRVAHDVVVNVAEAMKSSRGKKLLERIVEIETNKDARPIHTSVGVFLEVEKCDGPKVNAAGDEYTWIARNCVIDHNAILLDNVGAATPEQGVGIAVNAEGDPVEVETADVEELGEGEISYSDLMGQLDAKIKNAVGAEWMYVVDIVGDICIFETNSGYFQVPYRIDDGIASIVGIPIRVDKSVKYSPKTNSKDDEMRELMLNALKSAGIETEGLDDKALLDAYNKHLTAESKSGEMAVNSEAIAKIVADAVKPVMDELTSVKAELATNVNAEKDNYAELIGNSEKFPGMSVETAKLLPLENLKEMAANVGLSVGLPLSTNAGKKTEFSVPADMPE